MDNAEYSSINDKYTKFVKKTRHYKRKILYLVENKRKTNESVVISDNLNYPEIPWLIYH